MDKDEALDLALEALERLHYEQYTHQGEKAITAIKQALAAQLEHEPENEPHVSLASVREDWGPGPHEVHSLPPAAQPAPVREDWGPGPHEYHSLPAVPDALNPKDENPAYAAGWNDCRAEMLRGKP
jgi:hypothetical protein